MNFYELILAFDLASTLAMELFANLKDSGEEMTDEQFKKIAIELKDRRKQAVAKILAH